MEASQVGRNIKRHRLMLDLSQEELADRVGVSTSYLSHIETGRRNPDADLIIKIARALDVPATDLFQEEQVRKVRENKRGDDTLNQFFAELLELIAKYYHK